MNNIKTYLLENDSYFWKGLEDFCKNFDPNFTTLCTNTRNYMELQDFMLVGILSQPCVERLIVASAFEEILALRKMNVDKPDGYEYFQLEHFVKLIEYAFKVRENLEYGGFTIEVNYRGGDFRRDLIKEKWGKDCTKLIQRFVRENPDNLIINIYSEYEFQYRLTEANTY